MHVVDTAIGGALIASGTMEGLQCTEVDAITVEIAEAIAAETGTTPKRLDTPLYDVVDMDALEQLVTSDSLARVAFEYEGYVVQVDGNQGITVEKSVAGEGSRR